MTEQPPYRLTRALAILLGLAAVVVIVVGMRQTSSFLGPIALAATVAICAHPLTNWLRSHRVPATIASVITLVVVLIGVGAVFSAMTWALLHFAGLMPQYADDANDMLQALIARAAEYGVGRDELNQLLGQFDYGKLVGQVAGLVTSVAGLTFTAFLMLFVLAFMLIDGPDMQDAVTDLQGRPHVRRALLQAVADTRRNMWVTAVFGLGLAIVITIILSLLGVPGAPIWGVLTFITGFVPNIGFVIRLVPPALLALLDSGPGLMITVIIAFSIANVLSENVLQPRVVGQAAGVTPTVAMLSVIFWAFTLGPLGAILALPMTIFAKALLVDADPGARWVAPFLEGAYGRDHDDEPDQPETVDEPGDGVAAGDVQGAGSGRAAQQPQG